MDFHLKKLPQEEADKLRSVAIHDLKPFVPMPAPVYVFMRQNQKFVSVKGPLDFFIPDELARLQSFGEFYFPECVDSAAAYVHAAKQVRAILEWTPMLRTRSGNQEPVVFAPASYEISDAVMRILGPLWGSGPAIEPFFAAIFATELCTSLPSDLMGAARERDVTGYEHALIQAGWSVFLALNLGYVELAFINRLYERVFRHYGLGEAFPEVAVGAGAELEDLITFSHDVMAGREFEQVNPSAWSGRAEGVARKIAARFQRFTTQFKLHGTALATIHGERGFADV